MLSLRPNLNMVKNLNLVIPWVKKKKKKKTKKNKKSAAKRFYFSTSGEKSAKFEDFRQNNCVFAKVIAKNCAFQKISRKKKLQ